MPTLSLGSTGSGFFSFLLPDGGNSSIADASSCQMASGGSAFYDETVGYRGPNKPLFDQCMSAKSADAANMAKLDPQGAAAYNAFAEGGLLDIINPFQSAGGPIPDAPFGVPNWVFYGGLAVALVFALKGR